MPKKNNWERDIVKMSGGLKDTVIMGEIDIEELRKFQSKHDSDARTFKPLPDGSKMDEYRKIP